MKRDNVKQDRERLLPRVAREEGGVVAIIAALALVALLAMILLAVQVGDVGTVRGLLQGSADQAAMAGARQIDGKASGLTNAQSEAAAMIEGGKNFPRAVNEGTDLDISGTAFQTGVWDLDNPASGFRASTDPNEVNAVQVIGRKTASQNQSVPMFLGGFLGPRTVPIERKAIAAVGNCSELPCGVEYPIAGCEDDVPCGVETTIVTSDSGVDNGCWTGFFGGANGNDIGKLIDHCDGIPDIKLGDSININNGNITGQTYSPTLDQLKAYQTATGQSFTEIKEPGKNGKHSLRAVCTGTGNVRVPDPENPVCNSDCGAVLTGPPFDANGDKVVDTADCGMPKAIPLVPSSACASNCNQSAKVSGFMLFVITEVSDGGGTKFVKGFPVCGIRFGGTPTGPGPTCSPSRPNCCSTEPVLVNKDLM